jgi:DNA primase
MINARDLQDIKERTDCRLIIEHDLGKPQRNANGAKAWAWRCPLHNESKGYSLTAWRDGWKCWGACGTGGDAIKWLQTYHGMSFHEAALALGAEDRFVIGNGSPTSKIPAAKILPAIAQPPDREWQTMGMQVVETAFNTLWSPDGAKALAYLDKRGLLRATIHRAGLGYIPGDHREYVHYRLPSGARFAVPCGIVIPWLIEGHLWGIKVRRAAGGQKYCQVAGSQISGGGLYWADHLLPNWPVIFVEGEFDCLAVWQEAQDLINPVTLGAASNRLNPRWFPVLAGATTIFAAYDTDKAGDEGAARLAAITARVKRVSVPNGHKDVNELLKADRSAVRHWINSLIPNAERSIA